MEIFGFSNTSTRDYGEGGYRTYSPSDYCPIFKEMGINLVVRFNKSSYDKNNFEKIGINHRD